MCLLTLVTASGNQCELIVFVLCGCTYFGGCKLESIQGGCDGDGTSHKVVKAFGLEDHPPTSADVLPAGASSSTWASLLPPHSSGSSSQPVVERLLANLPAYGCLNSWVCGDWCVLHILLCIVAWACWC